MTDSVAGGIWLQKWTSIVWGMVGVGASIFLGFSLLTPTIDPMMPSALGEVVVTPPYDSKASVQEFASRPLFVVSRSPWRAEPDAALVKAEPDIPVVAESQEISGLQLVGIFSSGAARGAIVKKDTGDRSRVLIGDKIREWTLVEVESRSAVFSNNVGEARLNMTLSSAPGNYVRNVTTASPAESEADDTEKNYTPTFDNMYAAKSLARRQRAKGKSDEDAEEEALNADK